MSSFEDAVGDAIVAASADVSDVTEVPPVERNSSTEGFTDRIVDASAATDVQYEREQERRDAPDPEPDTTPRVYEAMGADRRDLESYVASNPNIAALLPAEHAASDAELARNIALVTQLREGQEASENLAWTEQQEAVQSAYNIWENEGSGLDALNAAAAAGDREAFEALAQEVAEEEPASLMLWQQAQQQAAQQQQNLALFQQQVRAQQQHAATKHAATQEFVRFVEANPDAVRYARGITEMVLHAGLENAAPGEIHDVMENALRNAKHVARIDALQRFRNGIVNSGELSDGKPLLDKEAQAAGAGLVPLVADNQGVLRHPLDGRFLRPQLTAEQVGDGIVAATGDPVTELFDSWRKSWREADEAA